MGGTHINQPVVGMAVDSSTGGYWLVAGDGGIFSFGAPFLGSTGAIHLNRPVVGIETRRALATDSSPMMAVSLPSGLAVSSDLSEACLHRISSWVSPPLRLIRGTRSSIQPEAFTRSGMQATSDPSLGRSPFPDRRITEAVTSP